MSDILVVEDNADFAKDAKDELGARVLTTYADFVLALRAGGPDVVLSDLYFPTGFSGKEDSDVREKSIIMLDDYLGRLSPNPVGAALEQILGLGVFGAGLEDYFKIMKDDSVVKQESFQQMIRSRVSDYKTMQAYKTLRAGILDGSHDPPCGLFVYRECKARDVPCVIVTSAYHHGVEFQPFVQYVGKYKDNLVDGRKPWKDALEAALGR